MKTKIKLIKSILIIIIVLGITVALLKVMSGKKPAPVNSTTNLPGTYTSVDTSPDVKATQLCYIWNTEAGDSAKLSMDIRGSNVIGELYWLPAEKDKKIGVFTGTLISNTIDTFGGTVNTFWNTKAEGMSVTEELKIKLDGVIAHPGFGEMKDRGDGVYVYADPNKVDYSLNLQKTDCGDSAMN